MEKVDVKKLLVIALTVVLLIGTGCAGGPEVPAPEEPPDVSPGVPAPEEPTPEEPAPADGPEVSTSEGLLDVASGFALHGSKVKFEGVYPGWSGTVPVTIINGKDAERTFRLSLMAPSTLAPGWEALPEEYHDWITISEYTVELSPGQIYEVPVTLTMPNDVNYRGKKAEIQILVEDTTQRGFVQIALAARWLIITAK